MNRLASHIRRCLRDRGGNTAMLFALLIPVVFGSAAMAVDYGKWVADKSKMQAAADASALNAARELQFADAEPGKIEALARTYARAELESSPALADAAIESKVNLDKRSVEVRITKDFQPMLSGVVFDGPTTVSVRAAASSKGLPVCVIALAGIDPGAVQLHTKSQVTANGCAVYSSSTSALGLTSLDEAVLKSALTCSSGGKLQSRPGNFDPPALTDCPAIPDPLASRPAPAVGPCTHLAKVVIARSETLKPGTYCGGLTITTGADVTLEPGVYVIKDGPLTVTLGSTMKGTNVGFFLTGLSATLAFNTGSTINLTAPKDGPLAGILVFEDRNALPLLKHNILSDNARTLLGTLYLPRGRLIVRSSSRVADASAYTIIVAQTLELYEGPHLVLNSKYGATDVPVPKGVGPVGEVYLMN